jgi:hypothetical protein
MNHWFSEVHNACESLESTLLSLENAEANTSLDPGRRKTLQLAIVHVQKAATLIKKLV